MYLASRGGTVGFHCSRDKSADYKRRIESNISKIYQNLCSILGNRRNQTDTEGVTDTEAYQSDAASVKKIPAGPANSFAAKLAANKAAGDAMPKTKKPQQVDANNNVIGNNSDAKPEKKMVKKDYTTKKQQQQNSDTEKSGDKPLPPRNNSGPNKRQIRNQQFREKKQAEQKQQELASKLPAPVVPVEVQGVSVAADLFV